MSVSFHLYQPSDAKLKTHYTPSTILQQTDALLQKHIEPLLLSQQLQQSVIPLKLNYDLKRDVQSRLEILERRTLQSIAEMVQVKIKQEEQY